MRIKTFHLIASLLLSVGSLFAQGPASLRPPMTLNFGITGNFGIHRMYGPRIERVFAETSSWVTEVFPEVNTMSGLGAAMNVGREGARLSLNVNAGLSMQYHHFSYDWDGFSRVEGAFSGTHKVETYVVSTDFGVRLKYSGRSVRPFSVGIGAFGGNSILTFTGSYVKLDRGNILRPFWVGTSAGPLVQASKVFPSKVGKIEPYVETRVGLNAVTSWPQQRNAAILFGANWWIGE